MITSSVEQEGKSTTVANLAVALARAGQRVALVDLDLRRPFIDRFFDLRFRPGLTQVALGHATLDEALIPVAIPDPVDPHANQANGNGKANGNGNGVISTAGVLNVMIAGPMPPNPGEFVGSNALVEILDELRERFDTVLVDAPPSLQVGDAMAISARVDAMMVITRLNVVRRPMLTELARLLAHSPAQKLGFIVTDAHSEADYGYGDGYYGSYERAEEKEHVA
jgi:Mrp family chromosome partitioning ATPase